MEDKQDTLLHTLFQSNLPPEELTLERLHSETISTIGGGTETTGRALSVACFHILDNPPVYQKLLAELVEAIPDPASIPSWADLEKVPYLTACIQESKLYEWNSLRYLYERIATDILTLALRLSYGIAERSRRTHDHDITYKNHLIPAGTIISMSLYSISHDESIFPSSYKFQPERWLGNPKAGPDGRPLTRYLVVFSKGTRGCIGMQLAYAELYITLASFFRRFRLSLVDTTRAAVDMWMDRFTPKPNPRSKGVQVMVERM